MSINLQRATLVLKALVSVALVAYLLANVSVTETWRKASTLSVSGAMEVILLLIAYGGVIAMRWFVVLRTIGAVIVFASALRITFAALFFNQVLPATVGADAVRVWGASRGGLSLSKALNSVILERVVHLLILSILAAVAATVWSTGRLPAHLIGGLWVVALTALAGSIVVPYIDRVPLGWAPAPIARGAKQLAADAGALFRSLVPFVAITATVVVGQAIFALTVYVLARDLGSPVSLSACMALLPGIVLVSSLPVSVAGWGVREYVMVVALGYVNVPPSSALALSLMLGLFSMLASLPGGVLWLTRQKAQVQPGPGPG